MATNKFRNVLCDARDSKLNWCYKKYMNKADEVLPILYTNVSYYSTKTKALLEERDAVNVDKLVNAMLIELQKQSSPTGLNNEDEIVVYNRFRREFGDPSSRSSLGRIYNNISSHYDYNTSTQVQVRNDGWLLIKRLLNTANNCGYLPSKWVEVIATLMRRAKFIAGRKSDEMSKTDKKISEKMFISAMLDLKIALDSLGEEPKYYTWDRCDGSVYEVNLGDWDAGIFDYHEGNDYLAWNCSNRLVNHYGVEWELDFKTRANWAKCMRALIKAGLMFDKDLNFLIQPMYDGSLDGGYPVEIIFAADTYDNITKRLKAAMEIFKEYDVKSSTERNNAGIHITQDWSYLKGEAFYLLSKYVLQDMPVQEYQAVTLRQPNSYCYRNFNDLQWVHDGSRHLLDEDENYTRYSSLNVSLVGENRLEWRMFNSCCDPIKCIDWIRGLNERFNSEAAAFERSLNVVNNRKDGE